jgi:hypothetical protein
MKKRLSASIALTLTLTLLTEPIASANNFSTGALLNSDWTCINPTKTKMKSIAESKVAELKLAPSSVTRKGPNTIVNFNRLNLSKESGSYQSITLSVFEKTKTYKRVNLKINDVDGEQKISFSVQVPTARIEKIVFNVSIQEAKVKVAAASCIPNSVYEDLLPKNSGESTPIPTATESSSNQNSNPVLARIETRIATLTDLVKSTPPAVEWVTESGLSKERLESLQSQHQKMNDAFPSLYKWNSPALALIFSEVDPIRAKMEQVGCAGRNLGALDNLKANPRQQGAGTTYCRGRLVAYFLERNMPMSEWNRVLGSEFGGVIQENAAKLGGFIGDQNTNWYSKTPTWYSEGGQSLISIISDTKSTKIWNSEITKIPSFQSPNCMQDTLYEFKCVNLLPVVAMELLVGLYGWDAPLAVYPNLKLGLGNEELFMKTFDLDFQTFNNWSVEYLKFLQSGKPLPSDLIKALKNS